MNGIELNNIMHVANQNVFISLVINNGLYSLSLLWFTSVQENATFYLTAILLMVMLKCLIMRAVKGWEGGPSWTRKVAIALPARSPQPRSE